MQERPGSAGSPTRPVRRPRASRGAVSNTNHTNTDNASQSLPADLGQHAAATPQPVASPSVSNTTLGYVSAADYFHSPAHLTRPSSSSSSRGPMSLGQPQRPSTPATDYARYGQAAADAADAGDGPWSFDAAFEASDFPNLYAPQGELSQDFPVQHQGSEQSAAHRAPRGEGVVQGPDAMPIVLGHAATQEQQQQQQQQQQQPAAAPSLPRQASTQSAHSQASLKRKSDSHPGDQPAANDDSGAPGKRRVRDRHAPAAAGTAGGADQEPAAARARPVSGAAQPNLKLHNPAEYAASDAAGSAPGSARPGGDAGNRSPAAERAAGAGRARKVQETPAGFSNILPAGKVFPIQIGSELFRLSGASISSDAPSYFSHFFSEQLLSAGDKSGTIKTLYIDRDPQTFRDISAHLQGYYVRPRDGEHYVRLFADAQFYSLPRLTQQLFKTDIYIQIGDRNFRIPRDIFSAPGNSPNFFSLGFAHFFSTPAEAFPGLDQTMLLRPPSIQSPSVPNRSADVFQDILHLLQGYPVNIRDEGHRQDLLRDARYFHLKGLEQKLIPCDISFNLARQESEMVVRLEDIRQSGVSFQPDADGGVAEAPDDSGGGEATGASPALTPAAAASGRTSVPTGYIRYARPFTDETARTLVMETSSTEATRIDLDSMRAIFAGQTKARVASLFQVIANKLSLPATQPLGLMMVERGGGLATMPVSPSNSGVSGDQVRVSIGRDSWCEVNGGVVEWDEDAATYEGLAGGEHSAEERSCLPLVRRWRPSGSSEDKTLDPLGEWVVSKAHWRLRVQPSADDGRIVEVVLQAVKLQAWIGERVRNGARPFLI